MRLISIIAQLAFISLLFGCAHPGSPTPTVSGDPRLQILSARSAELVRINTLAVVSPFLDRRVSMIIGRDEDFDWLLRTAASSAGEFTLMDKSKLISVGSGPARDRPAHLAAAKRAGADGVLLTEILDYRERQGGRLGADAPARVHFQMTLYQADGQQLWQATYLYQDQAVTANLLAINDNSSHAQGYGWRTAHELLQQGFESAFRELAERRRQAFMSH